MNAVFLLNPRFSGPEWRRVRLGGFIGTGLSAFAPIAHAWVLWGPVYLWNIGVPYYLLEGLLLFIGCWFWEVCLNHRPRSASNTHGAGCRQDFPNPHTPANSTSGATHTLHGISLLHLPSSRISPVYSVPWIILIPGDVILLPSTN